MPDNALTTQGGGTAITARDNSPVGQFTRQLETRARDIAMALPGHITPEKFQRTVLTAVSSNPDLLRADRPSLILSCYKAAQDGLLPDGREAALVTFNTRFKDPEDGQWKSKKLVQYMPMVYGLRKKILQSAEVVSLEVNVVYRTEVEKGTFLYEVGLEPPLRHRPSLDLTQEETTDDQIVGAYSIATMKDGTKSYELMRRFEIDKVRQVSQTGATGRTDRQGKAIEPKGPWVDWFAEMAKKTVMRRHAKTLPMSGDVLLDVEGRELDRGLSTATALGSQVPDEPLAIEDQGATSDEPRHDPVTGEIIDNDGDEGGDNGSEERASEPAKDEPKAESARPRNRRQAQPAAAEQPKSDAQPQPEATAEAAADDRNQSGVTRHPAEAKGDEILSKFLKAENIIDLERAYNEHEEDITSMPDEIYDVVMGGYNQNRVRVGASRIPAQQTEPAE